MMHGSSRSLIREHYLRKHQWTCRLTSVLVEVLYPCILVKSIPPTPHLHPYKEVVTAYSKPASLVHYIVFATSLTFFGICSDALSSSGFGDVSPAAAVSPLASTIFPTVPLVALLVCSISLHGKPDRTEIKVRTESDNSGQYRINSQLNKMSFSSCSP